MAAKYYNDDLRFRVFSKITVKDESSCWPWIAGRRPTGYGVIRVSGKTKSAHRVVYELEYGPIPAGLCVRHRCDNPWCCNPGHLLLGTHKDNMRDVAIRGRSPKAVLTRSAVKEIRRLYLQCGVLQKDLAVRFGVSKSAISAAISGRNYSSLGVMQDHELKRARSASRKNIRGEMAAASKMTEEIVRKLRKEYADGGASYRQLAKKYGMSVMPICNAIRGKSWAHVI